MEWIKESEDTTEYVNRSLISDAIIQLEKETPDVNASLNRLYSLAPLRGSHLISPPDFIKENE